MFGCLFLIEQVSDFIEGARRSILRTDHRHIVWLLQSSNSRRSLGTKIICIHACTSVFRKEPRWFL